MPQAHRTFVPAAGRDWLLPFYDWLTRAIGVDAAHRALIVQADLQPGQRVLDIGCGTGNLTLLTQSLHPDVAVVGLDPDPKALERAGRKAERRQTPVQLDRGFADELPYPDGSFDRVVSAFMLHHLTADVKKLTLREARRVLRPRGSLHLVDFGGEHEHSGWVARLIHAGGHLQGNSPATVLDLMRQAGFAEAAMVSDRRTTFGRTFYYRAGR